MTYQDTPGYRLGLIHQASRKALGTLRQARGLISTEGLSDKARDALTQAECELANACQLGDFSAHLEEPDPARGALARELYLAFAGYGDHEGSKRRDESDRESGLRYWANVREAAYGAADAFLASEATDRRANSLEAEDLRRERALEARVDGDDAAEDAARGEGSDEDDDPEPDFDSQRELHHD